MELKILPDTLLIMDQEHLCGDLENIKEEIVPHELVNLNKEALLDRYPAEQGWTVTFVNPKYLMLTLRSHEFCDLHQSYRHLGIYNGHLAVYEGPLGSGGKLLRVENITLKSIDPEYRSLLEQAQELRSQPQHVIEKLRAELEFSSDVTLNAVLENMDESS